MSISIYVDHIMAQAKDLATARLQDFQERHGLTAYATAVPGPPVDISALSLGETIVRIHSLPYCVMCQIRKPYHRDSCPESRKNRGKVTR